MRQDRVCWLVIAPLEPQELAVLPQRLGRVPEPGGLLGELHVGDAQDAATTKPGGEAEEHLVVARYAVEVGGEDRDRVDAALIAEDGGHEV